MNDKISALSIQSIPVVLNTTAPDYNRWKRKTTLAEGRWVAQRDRAQRGIWGAKTEKPSKIHRNLLGSVSASDF